jgi:hypothetical protein
MIMVLHEKLEIAVAMDRTTPAVRCKVYGCNAK